MRTHTEVVDCGGEGHLQTLTLEDCGSGRRETVRAAALFILIGAEPLTDWLPAAVARDERGYVLTDADVVDRQPAHWSLERRPLLLETSVPGVFAAGDVRHGSVKRAASAVGEGSITIRLVYEYLSQHAPTAEGGS